MAVIDEVTENGGTLFVENIKVNVKDSYKRGEQSKGSQVPRSVDLLLKKQEKLQQIYNSQQEVPKSV